MTAPLDVLIADDDAHSAEMLGILVRRCGHRTVRCDDLSTASVLLSVRCFDLALIDISGEGAVAAAEVARARIPRPRLVAVTGWAFGSLRDAAEAVFDEVRTKPLAPSDLDTILYAARLARDGGLR